MTEVIEEFIKNAYLKGLDVHRLYITQFGIENVKSFIDVRSRKDGMQTMNILKRLKVV